MRLLTVGNSFSADAMEYLYEIVKSVDANCNLYLGNLFYGGCTVSSHLEFFKGKTPAYEYRTNVGNGWETKFESTIFDGLLDGEWDIVSFQQASGFSGMKESYDCLPELIKLVREQVGEKPTFVWHMTWAYSTSSTHPHFERYENDQIKMYNAIVSAVKEKVCSLGEIKKVAPCGTAIQNARNTGLNGVGNELTRDGFHLDLSVGRYIAGLTLAKVFLGLDIEKVTFKPDGVTEEMKENAISCVLQATEYPLK